MNQKYKNKVVKATTFVIFRYGLSQVIRLAGNLILTRLLIPEYFGIITLASVFYSGIQLFSDFGIAPGIIRSARGDDPEFLNTAWSIQVIRGFILWFISIIIAIPVSNFYNEPILALIIPIISLDAIFNGFQSTSIITLEKELKQGTVTLIELTIQIAGLLSIIIVAYLYRNVWALVAGGLVSSVLKMIWSHFLNPDMRNKFKLDKSAVKELLSFGKWIFISTAMMFLATQADRLLLGKLFSLTFFGVYGIAVMFAELPKQIINNISERVIFPVISKFAHLPRHELRNNIQKSRRLMLLSLSLLVSIFACFGDILIIMLYDQRYEQAAWILPILAVGIWPLILIATIDRSLYAIGKPNYSAIGNFIKVIYMFVCVPLSFRYFGELGAVLAVAINDIPSYIIVNYGLKKENLLLIKQDLGVTLILFALITLWIIIRLAFGLDFPGVAIFSAYS